MTWVLLATVYGTGIGICLIGGVFWLMLLAGLGEKDLPFFSTVLAVLGWPVTFLVLAYKAYRINKEQREFREKNLQ